ncbi:MAG: thiamine pyrophosphate-binding protein, partial [Nitrospirota bacterium]
MKTSELFVRCLESEEVQHVFGLPGEENLDLLHALSESPSIRFIVTQDERWAAFMANAYGRLTGKPGVCLSTLGPGATNLLTGVADSLLDFSPMVAVTAQVGISKMHKESHQYVDILSAFRPVTKWNVRIENPATVPEITRKAFRTASFEKPGPCHIEFPQDVAAADAEGTPLAHETTRYSEPGEEILGKALSMIRDAKMPFILAGQGIIRGRASGDLVRFAEKTNIGVITTFMGMGAVPADHECFISTIGLQSRDYVSCGLDRADLIIAVGYDPVEFSPYYWNADGKKSVVHIHYTSSDVDSYYPALELVGDIKTTLSFLSERMTSAKDTRYYHALKLFTERALHFSQKGYPLKPLRVVHDIRKALGRSDILISDVGAHKIWIARFYPTYAENTTLISNGF